MTNALATIFVGTEHPESSMPITARADVCGGAISIDCCEIWDWRLGCFVSFDLASNPLVESNLRDAARRQSEGA